MLLEQEKEPEVRKFFANIESADLAITDFSIHSIGIVLIRLGKYDLFVDFLKDNFEEPAVSQLILEMSDLKELAETAMKYKLDFDDAHQYTAAEKHGLTIVSFDSDFDRTERGRKEPADLI